MVPVPAQESGFDSSCVPGNKFMPKPQEPREPAFDIENLKVALNNITIMYGPPDATIRQAERAMMAYLSELCNEEGH